MVSFLLLMFDEHVFVFVYIKADQWVGYLTKILNEFWSEIFIIQCFFYVINEEALGKVHWQEIMLKN